MHTKHGGFRFLGSGFRASDWISWISLFSFGLYEGGFRSRRWISWISLIRQWISCQWLDFVDFAF